MNETVTSSWNVDLQFRAVRGRTFLSRQYVTYPYHITRLLYEDMQERTTPKLILQSLSGGIYQGEQLWHRFDLQPAARADVRTQGSTIVQNARAKTASSTTIVTVGSGSSMLYFPEPQIIFNGADFKNTVSVRGVEQAAHVAIAESFLAYDPVVAPVDVDFRFTMTNAFLDTEGNELAIDKSIVQGDSHQRVMNGYQGYASFMFYGNDFDERFVAACCMEIESLEAEAAYSTLPAGVGYVVKALAADGAVLSQILDRVRDKCLPLTSSVNSREIDEETTSSVPC